MMMQGYSLRIATAAAALLAAGCFTIHHSEAPGAGVTRAPQGRDVRVALSGFEATVTTFLPVHTQTTGWHSGVGYDRHTRRDFGGLHSETWSSTTYIPQVNEDHTYVKQAADLLEAAGFILATTNAQYTVDVAFSGPVVTNGDRVAEGLWIICSLLSADYSAGEWTARLKIRETSSGRVVLMKDISQKCTVAVWGPIPVFSPLAAYESSENAMQAWTFGVLVDLAMAEATAYIAAAEGN